MLLPGKKSQTLEQLSAEKDAYKEKFGAINAASDAAFNEKFPPSPPFAVIANSVVLMDLADHLSSEKIIRKNGVIINDL